MPLKDSYAVCRVPVAALEPRGPAADPCAPAGSGISCAEDYDVWVRLSVSAARLAWPGVTVSEAVFLEYLGRKVASLPDGALFTTLRTSDLYLACACLANDESAILTFEQRYVPTIARALARLQLPPWLADDITCSLREKLFLGACGPPLLQGYSGRGELRSWVRSVAMHAGQSALRRPKGRCDVAAAFELYDPNDDPELEYFKSIYRVELAESLGAAIRSLSSREREILRLHYFEGLNIDAIGARHHVHRATVARWIAAALGSILRHMRDDLAARLSLPRRDLDSVMRLAGSGLDANVSGMLYPRDGAEDGRIARPVR
jgi:RNA polymerase sigma-70 factor (ECF subfamily)